jgi:thiol-disulfide isomerase/thioredoxin
MHFNFVLTHFHLHISQFIKFPTLIMTQTTLYLFLSGAFLMIAYTVFTQLRGMIRRKHFIPAGRKEWGAITGDLFTITASLVLIFILVKNYQEPMEAVMQFKGKELPDFRFYNYKTGMEETLADYKSKLVILNIWATWCPPCRREMPELDKLYTQTKNDGVEVIAISDEDPVVIKKYLSDHPFGYNVAWFSTSNELINSINTRPVSILVDHGLVKDIVIGSRGYRFFHDWVR